MALSADHAAFPLPSPNHQSTFSYNSSNSGTDDTISSFFGKEDYAAPGDFNYSSRSVAANDSLIDVLSKTLVHKAPGDNNPAEIAVGVTLAVLSNFFVGFSFVLKKQSLKQLAVSSNNSIILLMSHKHFLARVLIWCQNIIII